MSTKHTPGPWCVSSESPSGTIIKEDFSGIGQTSGRLIGSASGYTGSGFFPSDEEAKVNARLMAAAPELLAALERAVQIVGAVADGGSMIEHARTHYDPAGVCQQIHAAIAKATA